MPLDALDDAVVGFLLSDATLMAMLEGEVYLDLAPEGVDTPYVIVSLQQEIPTFEFGGVAFVTARYSITVYDKAKTKTAAQAAVDRIDVLLNDGAPSITGFTLMVCHRVERRASVRQEGAFWWQERACDYELWASPS